MTQASRDCDISNPSAIKYALDNGKPTIKRRSDKKIFYIREINLKYFFHLWLEKSSDSEDSESDFRL